MNPYTLLGLSKTSNPTDSDIARAYRRLALQCHPDRNPEGEAMFKQLNAAYTLLSDPMRRHLYDTTGSVDSTAESKPSDAEASASMAAEVAAFYATYAGSAEEREDLIKSFASSRGNFSDLMVKYALFDNGKPGEVERIYGLLSGLVEDGTLVTNKRWEKSTTKSAIKKVQEEMNAERAAAEEAIHGIHGDDFKHAPSSSSSSSHANTNHHGGGSLMSLIKQRQEHAYHDMMAGLEAKYGKKGNTTGKSKRGGDEEQQTQVKGDGSPGTKRAAKRHRSE